MWVTFRKHNENERKVVWKEFVLNHSVVLQLTLTGPRGVCCSYCVSSSTGSAYHGWIAQHRPRSNPLCWCLLVANRWERVSFLAWRNSKQANVANVVTGCSPSPLPGETSLLAMWSWVARRCFWWWSRQAALHLIQSCVSFSNVCKSWTHYISVAIISQPDRTLWRCSADSMMFHLTAFLIWDSLDTEVSHH